jgi:hypothetical protein
VARMRAAAVAHRSFNGSSLGLFRPRASPPAAGAGARR